MSKKIQLTVAGKEGKLVVSKVPAVNMESSYQSRPVLTSPIDDSEVVVEEPKTGRLAKEFVTTLVDVDLFRNQNFTELFTKRGNIKDSSKMSISALTEENRLRSCGRVGIKLLSALCDYGPMAPLMKSGGVQLKSLELFSTHAPHLINVLCEHLRGLGISGINEAALFKRFVSTFARKRRVNIRYYRDTHPEEVLIYFYLLRHLF